MLLNKTQGIVSNIAPSIHQVLKCAQHDLYWHFLKAIWLYFLIFHCPLTRLHTEILCHCWNEGLPMRRLCFCFYLAHWTRRARVLPHHSVIAHSEPALRIQMFRRLMTTVQRLCRTSTFSPTFTVLKKHQSTSSSAPRRSSFTQRLNRFYLNAERQCNMSSHSITCIFKTNK